MLGISLKVQTTGSTDETELSGTGVESEPASIVRSFRWRWKPGVPRRSCVSRSTLPPLPSITAGERIKRNPEHNTAIEASWSSVTPQQFHRLIASMPCCTEAVIHAKGAQTKY